MTSRTSGGGSGANDGGDLGGGLGGGDSGGGGGVVDAGDCVVLAFPCCSNQRGEPIAATIDGKEATVVEVTARLPRDKVFAVFYLMTCSEAKGQPDLHRKYRPSKAITYVAARGHIRKSHCVVCKRRGAWFEQHVRKQVRLSLHVLWECNSNTEWSCYGL
jgi:hypothetical protein